MANEYGEIEQMVNDVTSLDTARMTLRWALERLNSIEKEKADLKKNLTLAEETSKRLQLKEATLTDAYTSRSKTLEEKEDFYTKLEATMSLLGEGKLDIQQLLKKEAKLDSLRHSLESEYSDKFEELDRNQRSVIERWNSRLLDVESQYAGRLAGAQKKYDGLRSELEGDYQGRMTALQASFRSREKELSERIGGLEGSVRQSEEKVEARRRELESEYLAKKRETEESYRKLKNMLETGLEEKIRSMDCDHQEQISSFEASWQIERARLLEEQRVREDQFSAAQSRIKSIENTLAAQQEIHHSELLKIISEKETAFRAQLVQLENEKDSKEATVRELQARLEKKADVWEADRSRLQTEFDGRLNSIEAGLRERAASLETEYSAKKAEAEKTIAASREEFRKEFDAQLLTERQAMDAERSRLEWEKREREEALALNTVRLIELENALAVTREEHHKDLMERIRTGEASFREKLAGFESEKQAYNETINNLTDQLRRSEASLLEEKNLIAAEFEAKSAIHSEMLARTEASFDEKRRAYEERITALAAGVAEAAKASALEKENFRNELARVSSAVQAMADERTAAIRADYGSRKAALEKEFDQRVEHSVAVRTARLLEVLELAKAKNAELEGMTEERVAAVRTQYEERKAGLEREFETKFSDRMKTLEFEKNRAKEMVAATQDKIAEIKKECETEKNSLMTAYGEKFAFMEQELVKIHADGKEELAMTRENALREKESLQEAMGERERAFEERLAAAQLKMQQLKEEYEAERNSLMSSYGEKLTFMEQELVKAQTDNKEELAIMEEAALREREHLLQEKADYEKKLALMWETAIAEKREVEARARKTVAAEKALADERFAAAMDALEAEKNSLVSSYSEKLAFMEQELIKTQTDSKEELAIMEEKALRERERLLQEKADYEKKLALMWETAIAEKREVEARGRKTVAAEIALADERFTAAREAYEAEKNLLISAYGEKLVFMEQELIRTQTDSKEELAITQESAMREKERLLEENADYEKKLASQWETAIAERRDLEARVRKVVAAEKASADERFAAAKEAYEAERNSLVTAYGEKMTFMEQELIKTQIDRKEELAMLQESALREKERLLEEVDSRSRYVEGAELKIQELEQEMMKYRQAASGELLKNISEQDSRFREMAAEEKARSEASVRRLENLLSAKEKLLAEGDSFYRQKQQELDGLHAELNMRESKFNEELFAQKQALSDKEKALNDYRLKLEKDYAYKDTELEQMKAELTRAIMDYRKK